VETDRDTVATALYVRTDDLPKIEPERVPWRPRVEIRPANLGRGDGASAVMQALLGLASEARWLRFAASHLRHLFPTC
jgi:hypothetical protein